MYTTEHEIDLIEHLVESPDHVHQRDLARVLGLSLGMTNAIIARVARKGWITIRKVNNRNIHYAVTPSGIEQITRRSYGYLRRTIRNVVDYRQAIEAVIQSALSKGYGKLVLVGRSDLDFIVEYACSTFGLEFVCDESGERTVHHSEGTEFLLYAESYGPENAYGVAGPGRELLRSVVSRALKERESNDGPG